MDASPDSTSLELALEVADLGSWDVDLGTGRAVWNRRHATMQGYPPDLRSPTLQHWQRLVHPDDVARVDEALEDARQTRSLFAVEHRVSRADNDEIRWLALRGRFVYDTAGQPVRITGVSFDITDRKLADERLRESEARFRTMANHALVKMWITEPDGSCSFLNDRWYAFTGQTPATGLGYGWLDAVHPDDRDRAEAEFLAATKERRPFRLEYRLRRHDGVYRWAIDAAAPRLCERGQFAGFIGSVLDITDRKVAEQELEQKRAELETMLELVPAGIAIAHDPRGDCITVNRRFAHMLGLDEHQNASYTGPGREQLPYKVMRDGRELPGDELPMQQAACTGQEVHDVEFDLVYPDGRVVHLMGSAAPLFDAGGRVRGSIGAHADISALKRVQRDLEAADRHKDEFLATLAHELRNPLAPIRYVSRLFRIGAPPDALADAGRLIERQLAHMSRLLDDLLDVSRITRGTLELRREIVDLCGVVQSAVEAARPLAEGVGHRLELRTPAHAVPVHGDVTRLVQVVGNLLNNATRYTDPPGRISVDVGVTEGEAIVSVKDTGIGIPHELLPKLFALFTQGERTARSASGLGIGLALARQLVTMHGGQIEARSEGLGKGSEFAVRLPRASEMRAVAESNAGAGKLVAFGASGTRILVVDDNIDAADSLSQMLQLVGYSTKVAYEGVTAVELAELWHPGVVLLDLGLPNISGHEVARRLRREAWGRSMRLIAITGWGQEDDRRKSRDAGFDEHLTKPVDPDALLGLITRLVRGAA